jgi:hypothetical protein
MRFFPMTVSAKYTIHMAYLPLMAADPVVLVVASI